MKLKIYGNLIEDALQKIPSFFFSLTSFDYWDISWGIFFTPMLMWLNKQEMTWIRPIARHALLIWSDKKAFKF